jgi:hypothetical protein
LEVLGSAEAVSLTAEDAEGAEGGLGISDFCGTAEDAEDAEFGFWISDFS